MDALTLEHQLLPQQMETLRIKLDALDQEVRSRQGRISAEIGHFRNEDLTHLTHRIDVLTENFQRFRREIGEETETSRLAAHLEDLRQSVALLNRRLEQLEMDQQQAFAAETAWLAAVAGQLEWSRQRIVKGQGTTGKAGRREVGDEREGQAVGRP
ncbi:hypothetical protein [Candidatus Nitrospira bockiana]